MLEALAEQHTTFLTLSLKYLRHCSDKCAKQLDSEGPEPRSNTLDQSREKASADRQGPEPHHTHAQTRLRGGGRAARRVRVPAEVRGLRLEPVHIEPGGPAVELGVGQELRRLRRREVEAERRRRGSSRERGRRRAETAAPMRRYAAGARNITRHAGGQEARFETATVNQAAPKQWFCVSEEPARASARASTSQFESARASLSPESQRGPGETAISARWLNWRQARFTVAVSLRVVESTRSTALSSDVVRCQTCALDAEAASTVVVRLRGGTW